MSEKNMKRIVAARVMRDIRRRRAARKAMERTPKVKEDLFEQVKEKMVMRIYGVSSKRAKEIVAKRAAESAAREAENRARCEKSVGNSRRRVRSNDDEWIPMEDIIGMEVGEPED